MRVLSAVAHCVGTLLGPHRTLKCLETTATEEAVLTSDALTVMDRLGVEHPAGMLLLEACEGLHKAYRDGVVTMTVISAELAAGVVELHEQACTRTPPPTPDSAVFARA